MVYFALPYKVDLDKRPVTVHLPYDLATGDNEAHEIRVTVVRNGRAVIIDNAGVTAYVQRADRSTIVVQGEAIGNVATVRLTDECYNINGSIQLAVRISIDGHRTVVLTAVGAVNRTSGGTVINGGVALPTLDDLLAQIERMEAATDAAEAVVVSSAPPILVDKEIYNGGSTLAPNVTGAAVGRALQGLHIYGKAAQSATPSPSAPADLDVIAQNGSITTTVKEVYTSGVDDGIPSPQGMTVAVGDPLCGVPAMLGGQHIDADNTGWIADEVDYATGKIIRRTHRVRLTSTSHAWATTSISTRFSINNPRPTMMSGIAPVCSHFRGIAKITTGAGWVANNGGTQLVFSTDFATVDEWKDWLDANEVWLVYALAEETEQDLTEDEVAAYNAIRMHARSAVSNDAGADMLMTVMADTKTYVDSHAGGGGGVVDAPVKSVNGKTGDVVLTAEDVGAEPVQGDYKLIETITLTEDATIERTAEPDGTPYAFTAVRIRTEMAEAANADVNGFFTAWSPDLTNIGLLYMSPVASKSSAMYGLGEWRLENGGWYAYVAKSATSAKGLGAMSEYVNNGTMKAEDYPTIAKIKETNVLPAGLKVIIEGVRANA